MKLMAPRRMFQGCGSSSSDSWRMKIPRRVRRSSSGSGSPSGPIASFIVRNFTTSNGSPLYPGRSCRKKTGDPIVKRIAAASPAMIGDRTTARNVAPTKSTARLSIPASWRARTEVVERGDRRPRSILREGGADLSRREVARGEPARPELPPTRHLERDPDVLRQVDPREVVLEGGEWLDVMAGEVVVGHTGHIQVPVRGERGPDRKTRVDLEHAELAVARVLGELDVRDARVVGGLEQSQAELEHPRLVVDLEDGARAEPQRPLAHLPTDQRQERLSRAVDVGEKRVDVLVGVGHELLHDHVEASVLRSTHRRHRLVERLGDDRFVAERERVLLALHRLHDEWRPEA